MSRRQHRIKGYHQTLVNQFRKFEIILYCDKGFGIAVKPNMPNLCRRDQIKESVKKAVSCTKDGNQTKLLAFQKRTVLDPNT